MNIVKIVKQILESDYLKDQPPVLIDIGASGEINAKWKLIAPYSICIAFDADDRDFRIDEKANTGFKKLININRIVTADKVEGQSFYLTASPYCSSLLQPDTTKLSPWVFKDLFAVEKIANLETITLSEALEQAEITYIDWFKSDTQGTDLRLFKALPPGLTKGISAAEFEPGIMDAYVGEDKLHMVMKEMENNSFWLSSMEVKGTQRLHQAYAQTIGPAFSKRIIRKSPCWAEVAYLRQPFATNNKRQLLLLFLFALLEKQYGFALEVADYGDRLYNESIFRQCRTAMLKQLNTRKWKAPFVILKRQIHKLLSGIDD